MPSNRTKHCQRFAVHRGNSLCAPVVDSLAADAKMSLDSLKANPIYGGGVGVRFVFHASILACKIIYAIGKKGLACKNVCSIVGATQGDPQCKSP